MNRDRRTGRTSRKVQALAERVLSLDEPWRGRFLGIIGPTPGSWSGGVPSTAQLADRLLDRDVYRKVDGLLRMWAGPD
jgi:hypothetical protein